MIELALIYLLCLVCAVGIESRFQLGSLLERGLVVFTLMAAELILAVQALSLFDALTGRGLLIACAAFALVGCGITFVCSKSEGRASWKAVVTEGWREVSPVKWLLACGVALVCFYTAQGALMYPLDDSYHFEKPLFWIQNHSIAPFTVSNPRVNTTSFADAAVTLPGYLYCRSGMMFAVVTLISGVLSLGVAVSLTKKFGCSLWASACAGVLMLGFSIFALPFLKLSVASYLAGLWVGASLMFLMECNISGTASKGFCVRLGFSVFFFLMACGAKNTSIFLAPFYLAGMALSFRNLLLRKKIILIVGFCGVAGLVCSGTVWNYVENIRWYGNSKGPPFMQAHLSRELGARSVWTRIARGTALMAYDFIYVPASYREAYGALCQKTVRAVGGKDVLAEDDDDFYNFKLDVIAPRSGCGLAGLVFMLPALVVGVRRMRKIPSGTVPEAQRRNIALLLVCGLGYFLACHVFLRWQSIGLWRLMPAFPLIAAPLCGLLLEKFRYQLAALLLAGISTLAFIVFDTGMMARRFEAMENNSLIKKITASGRQHALRLEYQWMNEPRLELLIREDYTYYQVAQKFLERVEQPAVIGFVGDVNSENYFLFGRDYSNRVIPLNDSKEPGHLFAPPGEAKYIVFGQNYKFGDEEIAWAAKQGFAPVFQVFKEDKCVFMGFKRNLAQGP